MGKKDEAALAKFEEVTSKWTYKRETESDMTPEDRDCVAKSKNVWALGKEYLENEGMWKKEKQVDKIQLFSAKSAELKAKVFKVTIELEWDWKSVLVLLMDTEDNTKWNETLERCNLVASFPAPDLRNGSAWVTYMRTSSTASKLISQRDFCTCFRQEVLDDRSIYIGVACETSYCPTVPSFVRADQNILAMEVRKLTDTTCAVTQVTSIAFKGAIMQSIVDSQMVKSLTTYAQCLNKHVNNRKQATAGSNCAT